jgi:hypothetical protein
VELRLAPHAATIMLTSMTAIVYFSRLGMVGSLLIMNAYQNHVANRVSCHAGPLRVTETILLHKDNWRNQFDGEAPPSSTTKQLSKASTNRIRG